MHTLGDAFLVPLQNTLFEILSFLPRLLIAVILFLMFFILAGFARRFSRRSLERMPKIPWAVRILITRVIYLAGLMIGILAALGAANVNVVTVIESFGIAGFALGFALKDILENFISGLLLLFARPFELGHQVTLGEYVGTVTDIQIRTTTLTTYDGELVVIPNSRVYTNPVINHTVRRQRKYHVEFDTSLKADSAFVESQMLQAVHQNAAIAHHPEPYVCIVSLHSHEDRITWGLVYWADAKHATEVTTKSEMFAEVKRRLFDAGVPTPTATSQTILSRPTRAYEAGND